MQFVVQTFVIDTYVNIKRDIFLQISYKFLWLAKIRIILYRNQK